MTTIAYDGERLAGDKQSTFAGLGVTTTKVFHVGKLRVGCAGDSAKARELVAWVRAGRIPADFPKDAGGTEMMVIEDDNVLLYDNGPEPIVLEDRRAAIGSGRDYALMAMHLGQSAANAVILTALFDLHTGKGVDVL